MSVERYQWLFATVMFFVSRFGEISPALQNLKALSNFSVFIWQSFCCWETFSLLQVYDQILRK